MESSYDVDEFKRRYIKPASVRSAQGGDMKIGQWDDVREEKVDHPAHYGGDTPYEAIKVIEAWGLGFCLGNTVKYISRAGKKSANIVEDLKKAAWYLNREIERLEKE